MTGQFWIGVALMLVLGHLVFGLITGFAFLSMWMKLSFAGPFPLGMMAGFGLFIIEIVVLFWWASTWGVPHV